MDTLQFVRIVGLVIAIALAISCEEEDESASTGGIRERKGKNGDIDKDKAEGKTTVSWVDSPEPPASPDDVGGVIAEPDDDAAYIYDQQEVRTYELLIEEADLATLNANPAAEIYVPGALLFEGNEYRPVGVRYKGSVAAFAAPCISMSFRNRSPAKAGKCSIKVSFDEYQPDQRFYGLKKLQFHAMGRDPSMLRERLSYTMFRESGVPAPRSVHARLIINGQLEGLFALVEQIDGRFTRSRFEEGGKGNLYKEIWPLYADSEVYKNALETNKNEDPSVDSFVEFSRALGKGPEALTPFLDWKATLALLAADRVLGNDDGPLHFYCVAGGRGNNPGQIGNHNYFWYQAKDSTRFWLIPWDVDLSLGAGMMTRLFTEWRQQAPCVCSFGPYPPSCDPLVREFIGLNAAYEKRVDAFLEGPFRAENVDELLAAWESQINDAVIESSGLNGAPTFEQWREEVAELRALIHVLREYRGLPYNAP